MLLVESVRCNLRNVVCRSVRCNLRNVLLVEVGEVVTYGMCCWYRSETVTYECVVGVGR